jgi:Flp pilus assembly protein TadD
MAEQEEPVRRRVALKVIKLGMDTKGVIARFEAERQALALMEHPNIAKVLDAGATDTGRPFFVMELVRGIKITEYCDQNKVPTEERLKLFVQVCQAIQHAHQKGVIHRDIKPSNILVTLHDGVPVPKVIDFGIAKAAQGRLTDQTLFTAFEQFIGTPAYMSPEQAEMSGLDVDTRSDIYSLGVLLYELLTGKTPFDTKELLAVGLDELRRTIREVEPVRPSTRLTQQQWVASGAGPVSKSDIANRKSQIAKDLDWIVMKCLEKDRTRRYETANGLAMDIQRHLNNEPIVARPPSNWYRFQKLVRRNKVIVVASGAVVLALVLGLGLSLYLFVQERAARQRAVAAEQEQARLRTQAEQSLALEARLRQQAELGEKLSNAGRLLSEGQFEAAEKALDQIPLSPASATMFNSIGLMHVRRGEWRQAITNFSRMATVAPSEHLPYSQLGTLFAQVGDVTGYSRNCAQIIQLFGTNLLPLVAERLAKACVILPPPPEDLPAISKLAAVAVNAGPRHRNYPSFQLVQGLVEYREGHFSNALDLMQKVATQPGDELRTVQAYAIMAMAQHQLEDDEAARASLTKASELAKDTPARAGARELGLSWHEVLYARLLMAEAKNSLGGSAVTNEPPGRGNSK